VCAVNVRRKLKRRGAAREVGACAEALPLPVTMTTDSSSHRPIESIVKSSIICAVKH